MAATTIAGISLDKFKKIIEGRGVITGPRTVEVWTRNNSRYLSHIEITLYEYRRGGYESQNMLN